MVHIALKLDDYACFLQIQERGGRRFIFDAVRRKWLALFPEEMVRQLFIQFLMNDLAVGRGRIQVERKMQKQTSDKRYDLLVFDQQGAPLLLAECKAPHIPITQQVLDQVSQYNLKPYQAPYLLVTNGMITYCCLMNYEKSSYTFLDNLPNI